MRTSIPTLLAILSLAAASTLSGQQVNPTVPPPPPPAEAAPAPTSTGGAAPAAPIDPSTPPAPPPAEEAPSAPVFDPLHAQRSIDVGTFYLKKGNYDAAIDRFEEAARYQPKLAKPWVLLGETYEKKHDSVRAVESYKKYLELFPGAEDAAKVQKRIDLLEEKTGAQTPKQATN